VLPDLATELAAPWCGVVDRLPTWSVEVDWGRGAPDPLPIRFLEDVLDREAAGTGSLESADGGPVMAAPLDVASGRVLLLAGRRVATDQLAVLASVSRVLAAIEPLVRRVERDAARVERLVRTLDVASAFAGAREMQPLLELMATEATRMLNCDRASIFIHDRDRGELVACPALGVDSDTLRIPADAGIVGEVIQRGAPIRVDQAYEDERFDPSVDRESGYRTENLLCVPLVGAGEEIIGVFEVINRNAGVFDDDDIEALGHLARQAVIALETTRELDRLTRTGRQLVEQVTRGVQIIGDSPSIVALRDTIGRLAATDLPVLILGPSGTGKEVVSQALHFQGTRAEHPFIAVNCAALTETLLESELFGHEKGAFTDAVETRQGKFELADGGTLFLDEIGDMSPGGQAKLLRVLEQKTITRVGGSQTIPINVRVIAATNRNLGEAVRDKQFREDLYYRLGVVTLELPSLADRPEDIEPLTDFFLDQFCLEAGRERLELAEDARRRLQAHSWPGNIRELKNLIERVAFLCPGDRIESEDLAFILDPGRKRVTELSDDLGLTEATRRFQQDYIRRSIKRAGGNMSEAAKLLGLHRSNLSGRPRPIINGRIRANA